MENYEIMKQQTFEIKVGRGKIPTHAFCCNWMPRSAFKKRLFLSFFSLFFIVSRNMRIE